MSKILEQIQAAVKKTGSLVLSSAPDGFDAMVVADLARRFAQEGHDHAAALVFVARDGQRQVQMEAALGFLAPDLEILSFRIGIANPMIASPHMRLLSRGG